MKKASIRYWHKFEKTLSAKTLQLEELSKLKL